VGDVEIDPLGSRSRLFLGGLALPDTRCGGCALVGAAEMWAGSRDARCYRWRTGHRGGRLGARTLAMAWADVFLLFVGEMAHTHTHTAHTYVHHGSEMEMETRHGGWGRFGGGTRAPSLDADGPAQARRCAQMHVTCIGQDVAGANESEAADGGSHLLSTWI
jgi:hypothetical protein